MLKLSAIRCWNLLHYDSGVGSEWLCRHFYEWNDVDRLRLKISAQTTSVAQNCSKHTVRRLIELALPRRLKLKIKNYFKEKKEETKHGNFCKNLVCPNFSLPQKSELPKIWRGGGGGVLQPPSPNGTYPYGCYHLFFQLNNGVIIMDPITWIPKSS